ncbi:MAG: ATP-binding protein [Verrucomicrobiota bacterium]
MTIDSDSAKFSRALRSAILWPIGVIFAAAVVLLVAIFALLHEVKWSNHSYQVLAETRQCENLMIGSQNDVRGYLLTGDPSFTQAYDAKRLQAVNDLLAIKELVKDNPDQTRNLQDILQAKDTWFEHAKIMISHRSQEITINPDWVKMGTTILNDIDSRFERFIQHEMQLRDQRLRNVHSAEMALGVAGGVLAVLLSATVAFQVRKQMMQLAASYREALNAAEQRHAALLRSEKDLEEQKEWLRVTLTSIGDGVVVTDAAGRVVLMNHESERLTGWKQGDALHQPLADIFKIQNEETRATVADPVAKVLVEKKTVGLANHTVLLSRTGEEWPIEDSAAPILDIRGTILGVVLVFHDATSLRLAQRSLKAYSADLEKLVADRTLTLQQTVSELEAFSYTVSHDLRSPLRAMQGFSEAVLEDYADKLDDQGRHYLERIQNAAARLDRLIQDLLSYTRISRQETPLETLDLDKIVREHLELDASFRPPAANVAVDGTLPKVLGRESALNQVVFNLLNNAVKFSRNGQAPEVRIWSEDRGPLVRLWIEDHGIGIAERDLERIFDMFVQVNEAGRYGGTGVGLAIVKKAMQTMRGTAGVESKEGEGSRFWVELAKA